MARISGVDIPNDKRRCNLINIYLWNWKTNSN